MSDSAELNKSSRSTNEVKRDGSITSETVLPVATSGERNQIISFTLTMVAKNKISYFEIPSRTNFNFLIMNGGGQEDSTT